MLLAHPSASLILWSPSIDMQAQSGGNDLLRRQVYHRADRNLSARHIVRLRPHHADSDSASWLNMRRPRTAG